MRRLALPLVLVACGPRGSTVERVLIPAPSLSGSLIPEAPEQPALVYLPRSYAASAARYPVLYYLPGFTTDVEEYRDGSLQGFRLDDLRAELIVVVANGRNALGGSFYVNSPVTGRWEDFIADDVVGWVDSRYRTVADRGGRFLAGDSMGGTGALLLAVKHADRFAAVYALSPGLFAAGPDPVRWVYDDDVLAAHRLFATEVAELGALVPFVGELYASGWRFNYRRGLAYAYWAAFAPGAPFPDTPRSPTFALLERGFGGWEEKIAAHQAGLRRLDRIVIDYGRRDRLAFIPAGCEHVAQLLRAAGARVDVRPHDGGHDDRWRERFETQVVPLFAEAAR